MKSLVIAVLLLTSVAPAPAPIQAQQIPTPQDIQAAEMDLLFIQEIKLWKALQYHDLVTFNSLLLPDFIEVEKTIQNREQILANLNACTLVSFNFHNHQTRMLSPDAAVIAYNANSEITCGESHLKGSYNATTTWVRREGKWLVQIHTEIPIKS